jgi:hypothetical protein
MIVLSVWSNYAAWQAISPSQNNFQVMTRHILARQQPNDATFFFTAATSLSFNYYAHRENKSRPDAMIPNIVFPDFGETPSGTQPIPTKMEVETAIKDRERIWLILNQGSIALVPKRGQAVQMIRNTIEEKFRLQEEQKLEGRPNFIVALYVRK